MAASLANNRSVARQVTLTAITLVAVVLVLVGLAIAVLTERSTRAQVVSSVGNTAQSVAQSLDAADNTNRELVQLTMRGFQRYFEAHMHLDEATGELRSYGALVNEDYGSVDKFASETGGIATVFAKKGDDFIRITTSVKNDKGERQQGTPLGKDDPAYASVIASGMVRVTYMGMTYFVCGIMETCCGMVRGLGRSWMPMVVTIFGACVLRIIWIYTIFQTHHTLDVLYLSYPVSWVVTSAVHVLCFVLIYRRMMARWNTHKEEENAGY